MCRFLTALGVSAQPPHCSGAYCISVSPSPLHLTASASHKQAEGRLDMRVDGAEVRRPGLPLN